jgi:hypothetical protein
MRHLISTILLLLLFSTISVGQDLAMEINIIDSGKYEFKQQAQSQKPDYSKAFRILSNQVRNKPNNAELKYFLGYAIDRLNAEDGRGMLELQKVKTLKASEQFEQVNKIEPIYKGEYFTLDPYSKITSIWGSLAQSFLSKRQTDSAKWAFIEGKKRGGFTESVLEFNRQLLNNCDSNSILITYGDNVTIPTWYLQTIEKLRNDITIVDANLINTIWYPKYLKSERNLKLSFSSQELDTVEYLEWKPTKILIKDEKDASNTLNWELKPTYMNSYILRGDRILLDIFNQNYFKRPIHFSSNSDSTYNLFLSSHLIDKGLTSIVSNKNVVNQNDTMVVLDKLANYSIERCSSFDIKKSRDAIVLLNNFRWAYFSNIYHLNDIGKYDKAKGLINEMNKKFPKEKLPFESVGQEQYFNDLFLKVEKNYSQH